MREGLHKHNIIPAKEKFQASTEKDWRGDNFQWLLQVMVEISKVATPPPISEALLCTHYVPRT